ncbi:putative methionyl-tRNA synthetase [Hordeum vulgare]|nr:putative methionyl-tRNA synthetase [Hordeum vulgare]
MKQWTPPMTLTMPRMRRRERKSWWRWNQNQCRRRRGERKRALNTKPAEPRVKWTSNEDECLAEVWNTSSIDPISGTNQNTDTYWGRIKTAFDECKLIDPDFVNIHMDRGEKGMSNHWSTIQMACNKWHGIVEEVVARPESSANVEGRMVRMFAMYCAANEDQEFKFLHMFFMIESCEKWREVRLALDKAKETYNPDMPATAMVEGRPDGTIKAREMRDAAPIAERLQASIGQCMAYAKSSAARREEKSYARWSVLMTKQDVKLDLLRINVAAKKRNTDLAFLMRADTSTMDEQVKASNLVECGLILI